MFFGILMCAKYSELRSRMLSFSKCNKMDALRYDYFCTPYYFCQNAYTHSIPSNYIIPRLSRTRLSIARCINSNVRRWRYFWFIELKWSVAHTRKYFWNSEAEESETESELDVVSMTVTNLTERVLTNWCWHQGVWGLWFEQATAATKQEIMWMLACLLWGLCLDRDQCLVSLSRLQSLVHSHL